MTALAADKNTVRAGNQLGDSPTALTIAASTKIYQGAGACRNATGYAVPASTSATLVTLGIARAQYDNTAGANGALTGEFDMGDYFFGNSASTDLITDADVGNDCYWVDDQTVAKTSNSSARSRAGKVVRVDATFGVAVRVGVGY